MPSWGRTSNPQEAVPCLTVEGVGTQSPTCTFTCYMRHGQLSICFPSLHQVSIDVTAGWAASPVGTRPPGPHFNSWVDWSNVSKISCPRKQKHQSGPAGNQTWNFSITRASTHPYPRTHTHTHKASGSHAKHSYCRPVNQHWDACAPLRHLSLVQANPPGAGKSSWGRDSNPQEDCLGLLERGRGT